MRAVMTATVSMEPTLTAEAPNELVRNTRRLASRPEIRQALSTLGLTPPPLMRYRDRALGAEPEPDRSERELFRQLTQVIGAAAKDRETISSDDLLVLDDTKAELHDFSDAAAAHIPPDTDEDKADALRGIASYALPVLTRMPARSGEDRDKRRAAADSLLFASTITPTRALFIVSSENESAITFRLHHQLIERLQRGSESLVEKLDKPIDIQGGRVHIEFEGQIEIYEVGQEDSTIMSEIVGTSRWDRVKYSVRKDRVQYAVLGLLLLLLFGLLVILAVGHGQHSTITDPVVRRNGRAFVQRSDAFWRGQAERLQSGLIPVVLVTAITVLVRFPRGVVVRWTQRYTQGRAD